MRKWDIRELLFEELPFGEGEKIEITSTSRKRLIRIHGVRRVLDYSSEKIGLLMKKDELIIEGQKLTCITYTGGAIGIEGNIMQLSFVGEEK